jgi:hypothetical protein
VTRPEADVRAGQRLAASLKAAVADRRHSVTTTELHRRYGGPSATDQRRLAMFFSGDRVGDREAWLDGTTWHFPLWVGLVCPACGTADEWRFDVSTGATDCVSCGFSYEPGLAWDVRSTLTRRLVEQVVDQLPAFLQGAAHQEFLRLYHDAWEIVGQRLDAPAAKSKLRFYLGAPEPSWLRRVEVPLFVSVTRLRRLVKWPVAKVRWAMDSGGFTEIQRHGKWTIPPAQYIGEVRRARDEIGHLDWAPCQDWMVEPQMLSKTGLTIRQHQRRTVDSFLLLRRKAPDLPWMPVLQGWTMEDYERCAGLYAKSGVDLSAEPIVGLGSVCRRQGTRETEAIVRRLAGRGLRLHGFGVKVSGLVRYADVMSSADSMAWSFRARKMCQHRPKEAFALQKKLGCKHKPGSGCQNCLRFALWWREQLLVRLAAAQALP